MKRKLSFTEQIEKTSDKIMKWNETKLKEMDVSDLKLPSGGRRLNFKLTEKNATNNLLKAADSSLQSETSLKHSTRNGSMTELLLCEDITINTLPPISCDEEQEKSQKHQKLNRLMLIEVFTKVII